MHLSTPALAFAIIGFTSALPAAIISKPAQHSSNLTTSAVAPISPVTTSCTTPIPAIHTTSTTTSASSTCTSTTSISTSCTTPSPNPCRCGGSCPSCTSNLLTPPACDPKTPPCKPIRTCDSGKTDCMKPSPPDSKNHSIKPCVTSQYDVWTGAVRRDEARGKVFKNGRKTDVTTLLTFNFPPETKGKTCSFRFDLSSDSTATVSGTGQFDVFVSLAPATKSADTWPSGNLRDQHIGRMNAGLQGAATWVAGFPTFGQAFPCPAGETYGAELVGVGDLDDIEWLAGTAGPRITWSE